MLRLVTAALFVSGPACAADLPMTPETQSHLVMPVSTAVSRVPTGRPSTVATAPSPNGRRSIIPCRSCRRFASRCIAPPTASVSPPCWSRSTICARAVLSRDGRPSIPPSGLTAPSASCRSADNRPLKSPITARSKRWRFSEGEQANQERLESIPLEGNDSAASAFRTWKRSGPATILLLAA